MKSKFRQGNYKSVRKIVRKFSRLLCCVESFNFKQKRMKSSHVLPNLPHNTAETCNRVVATRVAETEETCRNTQRLKHSSRLRKQNRVTVSMTHNFCSNECEH